MSKITDKHSISEDLCLFKQERSTRWVAYFKVDGKWYQKSTKEKQLQPAIVKAHQLQTEYQVKIANDIPVQTSRKLNKYKFNAIADQAIERMEADYKPVYLRLIAAIKQYHKPFFGQYLISELDDAKLKEFDDYRTKVMKRVPAKATVVTHNTALQRVFDEAIQLKYITSAPKLSNTGQNARRRAHFEREEYDQIVAACKQWADEAHTEKSRLIRQTLYFYIQIATLTGIRPGSEMEHLTWNDLQTVYKEDKRFMSLTIRKGKTTKHTGTRTIICKNELCAIIDEYADIIFERADIGDNVLEQQMFNLEIGKDVFGKNFTKLLKQLGLQHDANGTRSLYSLRHSYITWELQNGTPIHVIAKQCGTSIELIERNYSHVVPSMYADQLAKQTFITSNIR